MRNNSLEYKEGLRIITQLDLTGRQGLNAYDDPEGLFVGGEGAHQTCFNYNIFNQFMVVLAVFAQCTIVRN